LKFPIAILYRPCDNNKQRQVAELKSPLPLAVKGAADFTVDLLYPPSKYAYFDKMCRMRE